MVSDVRSTERLLAVGSRIFTVYDGAIPAGASVYHDITFDNPETKNFVYVDSIIVFNQSAQPIQFFLNSSELYAIPANSMLPVNRPMSNYKIVNVGSAGTNANEIAVQYRRLPPNIVKVQNV